MKKFRVLVSDSLDSSGVDILRSFAEVDVKTKLSENQLVDIIRDYDALVVRSATKVTSRIIDAGKKLRIIGRAGVGVDNVDISAATERGIFVVNSPQGNTVAAAEHTLALMFALSRHVAPSDASMRGGQWAREKFMGVQLQHKTLGIVGLGQVGSHVAKVAREIGMDLLVYDPYINTKKAETLECRVVTLNELLTESDYVTLHVPLVSHTKHLINAERIKLMKSTARIINCSRGGVIDEIALCEALKSGTLAGAALELPNWFNWSCSDVFEEEGKINPNSSLVNTPNLLLTPHLGASTIEAQVNVATDVAHQLKQALQGNFPDSAVNISGLRASELSALRPLLECCETLGRLAMQLLRAPVESISVTAEGDFANLDRGEALLLSAANGVLGVHSAIRVNFVNVRAIADEQKIKMLFIKDPHTTKSGVSVEVRSGDKKTVLRGTVTEDNDVLLKAFDGVPVYMILPFLTSRVTQTAVEFSQGICSQESTENLIANSPRDTTGYCDQLYDRGLSRGNPVHDEPGVLAQIATALGNAGVNIANCHIGRHQRRKGSNVVGSLSNIDGGPLPLALAIFHVDGMISEDTVEKVKKVQSVRDCVVMTL